MANATGGEHSVQIQGKMATPEKWLNRFVRLLALMERMGNALGTLAFTWATVVLLGGYPTVLGCLPAITGWITSCFFVAQGLLDFLVGMVC
uniref:Uncharacterized protein n=1 Tax=Oryza nivara TaxID=4536 RepID=A0A0E0I4Y2_ORYNI